MRAVARLYCTFGHTVGASLGQGSFGKVFAATTSSGGQVAIKHVDCTPGEMPSTLQREVAILQQLTHPHIVRLLEVIRLCFAIDLVFELCETTLRRIIKQSANSPAIFYNQSEIVHVPEDATIRTINRSGACA